MEVDGVAVSSCHDQGSLKVVRVDAELFAHAEKGAGFEGLLAVFHHGAAVAVIQGAVVAAVRLVGRHLIDRTLASLIHIFCMKTTLNFDNGLIRAAKTRAAQEGETLTRLVERALRDYLQAPRSPAGRLSRRIVDQAGPAGHRGQPGRPGHALRADGRARLIAVDTNILVHAHREEAPKHGAAYARVVALAESPSRWGIPVFCIGEFVRVITHPRLFDPPYSAEEACEALTRLLASPSVYRALSGPRLSGAPGGSDP